jgi:hypothetical protein
VDDAQPELIALLDQAGQSLDAFGILSDWLRDRDDARAEAVADLAAPGVVPDTAPEEGEEIALVTGRRWWAWCSAYGVHGRVQPGTELAALTGARYGAVVIDDRDRDWHHYTALYDPNETPLAWIAAATHACRAKFLFSLFGLFAPEVYFLHELHTSSGVAGVADLIQSVPRAAGARWLRGLRQTDPKRCAAIMKDL